MSLRLTLKRKVKSEPKPKRGPKDRAPRKPKAPRRAKAKAAAPGEVPPSLVVLDDPTGHQAKAIQDVSERVITQLLSTGRRGLAVCGVTEDVGVTFVAANLAVALSQAGVSTLLVDTNLNHPSLHRLFACDPEQPGLQQLLRSEGMTVEAAIQHDVLPNLSLLPAGGGAIDAADADEVIGKGRFRTVIEDCMRLYDIAVVDTPPACLSANGQRVSAVLGYAIIVARRDTTYVEDLAMLRSQLEAVGAVPIGAVLNRA